MSKALEKQTPQDIVEEHLRRVEDRMMEISPLDGKEARQVYQALIAISRSNLDGCSVRSIYSLALDIVALGLDPSPALHQVAIYPRKIKGTLVAFKEIEYPGYITLAVRGGMKSVRVQSVYKNDQFEYCEKDGQRSITWAPWWHKGKAEPGDMIATYLIAHFANGYVDIDAMPVSELDVAKSFSPSARKGEGPWHDVRHIPAMRCKTHIKRRQKYWPIHGNQLALAAEMDDRADDAEERGAPEPIISLSKVMPADDLPEGKHGFGLEMPEENKKEAPDAQDDV